MLHKLKLYDNDYSVASELVHVYSALDTRLTQWKHTGKSRGGGGGGLSLIVVVGSEELTVRGIRCQRQPGPLPLIKQRHGETACRNTERQKSALILQQPE